MGCSGGEFKILIFFFAHIMSELIQSFYQMPIYMEYKSHRSVPEHNEISQNEFVQKYTSDFVTAPFICV